MIDIDLIVFFKIGANILPNLSDGVVKIILFVMIMHNLLG